MGESGRSAGTGTALPRGAIALYLNSTTGVKLWQSDDGQPVNYRFQVLEWPKTTSTVVSVVISTDAVVSYGTISGSANTITLSDTQTATNDGNVTENFSISGQNTACPWTLAASAGNDQYVHEFSTNDGSDWTLLTTSYQTLATGVAQDGTVDFDLQITIPTSSSCDDEQSVDITILAEEQ